jgi:hypothetical protein
MNDVLLFVLLVAVLSFSPQLAFFWLVFVPAVRAAGSPASPAGDPLNLCGSFRLAGILHYKVLSLSGPGRIKKTG